MQERLTDAEQQKAGLKKQIENFMNEEDTMQGENAKVLSHCKFLTTDPTSSS
jgi:hypothetical protein